MSSHASAFSFSISLSFGLPADSLALPGYFYPQIFFPSCLFSAFFLLLLPRKSNVRKERAFSKEGGEGNTLEISLSKLPGEAAVRNDDALEPSKVLEKAKEATARARVESKQRGCFAKYHWFAALASSGRCRADHPVRRVTLSLLSAWTSDLSFSICCKFICFVRWGSVEVFRIGTGRIYNSASTSGLGSRTHN